MSGHSKWAQIKRKKATVDAKRGTHFTQLIREITVAARQGGGDPDANPRLRSAVQSAKAANMPNDNIERAIKKGTGELGGVAYEEVTYEAYGPGGAAIMIEVTTDNLNRTVAEIRHVFSKRGGNLGSPNSVAWMFEKKGQMMIDAGRYDEDQAMEKILEAGAEDIALDDDHYLVTTDPSELHAVAEHLQEAGIEVSQIELVMIPSTTVTVVGKEAERLISLMDALDEVDDVSRVFSNFETDSETLAKLSS